MLDRTTVRRISPDGQVITLAGAMEEWGVVDGLGNEAWFREPVAIAVDRSGSVLIVERMVNNGGIFALLRRISALGEVTTFGQVARGEPRGVTVDSEGTVWVLTAEGIYSVDANGNPIPRAIDLSGVPGGWQFVSGSAFDSQKNLYVCADVVVYRISIDGRVAPLAGSVQEVGSEDGPRLVARFNEPAAMTLDRNGNLYVVDRGNGTVRKVTSEGNVTTLAGTPGDWGNVDGVAHVARFSSRLGGIVADEAGNVFVADTGNHTIRKIDPSGNVVTFAGSLYGRADGIGVGAQFARPAGLASDEEGNLLVVDVSNNAIRKVTPDGVVSTWASLDGVGHVGFGATLGSGASIVVGGDGNVYVEAALSFPDRMMVEYGVVKIDQQGVKTVLWKEIESLRGFGGMAIDDRGNLFVARSRGTIGRISPDGEMITLAGREYQSGGDNGPGSQAQFSFPFGIVMTPSGELFVSDYHSIRKGVLDRSTRLAALAVRGQAGTGERTLIMGVVTAGRSERRVLVRALGPQLGKLGVGGALGDPRLKLFRGSGEQMAENDDWDEELAEMFARLGAGALDVGSKDAATVLSLASGVYTAHVTSGDIGAGVALAEVYDADEGDASRLTALAVRSHAGRGDETLIAGFVLKREAPKTVLIRGVGPSLGRDGVSGVLSNPTLRLYRGGEEIGANDDWAGTATLKQAFAAVGAGSLEADTSKDAALLVSLEPGVYTAHVSGADGGTGVALVEVYAVE